MIKIISCALLILLAGCSPRTVGPAPTAADPLPAAEPVTARPTELIYPPGTAVQDGKFRFHVEKFGVASSTDTLPNAYPQGVYLLVRMTVENVGNEPKTFFSGAQELIINDRSYATDSTAAIYLDSSSVDINPGNSAVVTIAFDIPAETQAVDHLELHDSTFSRGVLLALHST